MKRPSMKFDKDAILAFLLNHCEKLVVGVIALAALGLAWGGIDALRLKSVKPDQTPAALTSLNANANNHIDAATKPPAANRKAGRLALAIDPWRPQQVKIVAAPEMSLFDRPLFQELAKRTKPNVFPIEDLRAVAGIAVLPAVEVPNAADVPPAAPPQPEEARPGRPRGRGPRRGTQPEPEFAPPGPGFAPVMGDTTRGRIAPYVIVTGLVPVAKQQEEFERCFASTGFRDRDLDAPKWGQYLVERSVVGTGGAERWERLKLKNVEALDVAGGPQNQPAEPMQPEILPPAFLVGATEAEIGYAAGVPQRIDDSWGFAAIHPWFLPQLKRLLEQNQVGVDVDRAVAPADAKQLRDSPDEFVGKVVLLEGMKFVGDPDPQRQAGVVAHAVATADGGVKFATDEIGTVDGTVFAIAGPWARTLALDGGVTPDIPCTLRVRLEMIGPTPVARILGIKYAAADGGAGEELFDPNPLPLAGGQAVGLATVRQPGAVGPEEGAEFRLFRFVDTDVKPGLRYSYRVKFALRNPNFGLDQQHLADPTLAKGEFLVSKESNQSPPVRVPEPTSMLAKPLTKDEIKRMKMKPGWYEILVLGENAATGNYAIRSLLTEVGGLANVDPALNKPGDQRTRGEAISTGRILVDARGRQEDRGNAGSAAGPGDMLEMLFFDPTTGAFEFVSAADSQSRYDRYALTLPLAEDPKKGGNQPAGLPANQNPFEFAPPGRGGP
ncbi:MAG: hypothetical protein K8S94_08475 [Planctomycetia bacterium]|nr:hypothetical protein [Planctomycetia bacterium]